MKKGFPVLALAAAFLGLGGSVGPVPAPAGEVEVAPSPAPVPKANARTWALGASWHGTSYKPKRQRTRRTMRVDAARVRAAFGMSKSESRAWVRAHRAESRLG